MENMKKKTTLGQALLILFVIMLELVIPAFKGVGLVIPLFLTWPTIYIFCRIYKFDWNTVLGAGFDGMRSSMTSYMIFLSVGILIGAWLACGCIPTILYVGLKLINPKFFLLCTLIICSIMSVVTGTSFGSAASAGLAMMGVGLAMGINPGLIAGAIICGSMFGDKMSPMSDTTNLTATVCDTPLMTHVKSMLYTTVPAYIITCIIFTVLGFQADAGAFTADAVNEMMAAMAANFHISVISVIPAVIVIVLLVMRMDALPAIMFGVVSGLAIAVAYQGVGFLACLDFMYNGFSIQTGNEIADKLLNRGGLMSMNKGFYMLFFSIGMGAMLNALGVTTAIIERISKGLNSTVKLVSATMAFSYLGAILTCAASPSHVICGNLLTPLYKEKGVATEVCSRTLEDCATLGSVFFPWNAYAVYFTGVLGITFSQYIPYVYLCFIVPVFSLICAVTGWGIFYQDKNGNYISKEEHEKIYAES